MDMHEQLEAILATLGVEMEQPTPLSHEETECPEISLFQSSREHYGVFYRVDLLQNGVPHLRVFVPTDTGPLKLELYLVRLNERSCAPPAVGGWFAALARSGASPAFERCREAAEQYLLHAAAEVMKQLFWAGDLESGTFPPEIDVQRLL